ncbi:non-homologous end-joining DNA ligase [Cohnella kolymensis]|uniref:non-homologous end-joining DNA ligase n=1 Tax=Cohnella kolymensis TaxID=1590652 RepID=UPI000AF79024|nr:non-homologous end-joining DNA ligase [Cohnella kolymensis]
MTNTVVTIENKEISISHPERILWPDAGVTKFQYIQYLMEIAPFMLPYTTDRMLMIWRYPEGITGRRVEERSIHGTAPEWLPRVIYGGKERILLNDRAALVWVANRRGCELHVPFDKHYRKEYPTELVFDLDPAEDMDFGVVLQVALKLHEVLSSLSLHSFPKTSGATGLQIFVPVEPKYTFEQARQINEFIAKYMLQQLPDIITLERVVERRGSKLYFDYLQLWRGRTMAAPYSVRAKPQATVSAPVTWEEAARGFVPADFTIANMTDRIGRVGDLFRFVSSEEVRLNQQLDKVLDFIQKNPTSSVNRI